ncbi:hypothetical protein MAH1_09820 [Sessilibacter sp. MAH1]
MIKQVGIDLMADSILQQGFDLMLFGMGTVMVFLALLVVAMNVMSSVIAKFQPSPVVTEKQPSTEVSASATVDPHLFKVIQAALDQHRKR